MNTISDTRREVGHDLAPFQGASLGGTTFRGCVFSEHVGSV